MTEEELAAQAAEAELQVCLAILEEAQRQLDESIARQGKLLH